jgi:hypothetical protein
MLKKCQQDFLVADLAAVERLLSEHVEVADPIGYWQFTERKKQLQQQLLQIDPEPEDQFDMHAYFSGEPVENDHGIRADFAANVISLLNALVAQCGGRLLVTMMTQRSIGFMVQTSGDEEATATQICVLDILQGTTAGGQPIFNSLLTLLVTRRATMRVVSGNREVKLSPG